MEHVAEQKCPGCGAALRFDPEKAKLVCDFCGTEVEIAPEAPAEKPKPKAKTAGKKAGVSGFNFQDLNEQATDPDAEDLPVYNCISCGAEVIAPREQMALTCPYCGNNIVLTDKITGKLRPDGVIPFKITPRELPQAMNKFYRKKKLMPRGFFTDSTIGQVTGVYVPFWVFSGELSGRLIYRGEQSETHRSGSYLITDTHHYQLTRDVGMQFRDVPVDASGRIDDKLMDSLEPFRMEDVQNFDMRYLAGFTADRFDKKKNNIAHRAENRMDSSANAVASTKAGAGYSGVRKTGGALRASLDAKYLLLPVYLFDVDHGGKSYHYAFNGQTGKVVGQVPTDELVSRLYFLVRFGAVSAGILLIFFLRYMLGG